MGDIIPFRRKMSSYLEYIEDFDEESELYKLFHEFANDFRERGYNIHSITLSSDNYGYDDDGDLAS
jgi:hypothetical protein